MKLSDYQADYDAALVKDAANNSVLDQLQYDIDDLKSQLREKEAEYEKLAKRSRNHHLRALVEKIMTNPTICRACQYVSASCEYKCPNCKQVKTPPYGDKGKQTIVALDREIYRLSQDNKQLCSGLKEIINFIDMEYGQQEIDRNFPEIRKLSKSYE